MPKNSSLKTTASKGILWSALDKFALQAGQFIVGIILARLLMPTDFGLIGMLSIFIAISQSFIDSGMGSGLIQKKNRSDLDFSTVFVFNFAISVFFYGILFITAPYIANFYEAPQLVLLTRVLGINIVISSLAIVQRSKLTIAIDFKTLAKVNILAFLGGGVTALYLAYTGWGVWALVAQTLVGSGISVLAVWSLSKWTPSIRFSKKSFNALFGFGSKLLIAGVYAQTLNNVYNIVIGKSYATAELGYYTRARSFSEMASGTITSILHQVTYPILASIQDDRERLVSVYSRIIGMTAFLVFPIMTIIALLADPLVRLLLTEKWAPAVPLLQLLCIARMVTPISAINMNILNAVGRSDLFLKVDLSKFPVILLAMLVTIPMGVKAIVIGQVVTSILSFFINAYMPGKLFGYGGLKQLKDMTPLFVATSVTAIAVFFTVSFIENLYFKLISGGMIGFTTYLISSYFLRIKELKEIKLLLLSIKNK